MNEINKKRAEQNSKGNHSVGKTDEVEDFEIPEEIIPGDAPQGVDAEANDESCPGGACKI